MSGYGPRSRDICKAKASELGKGGYAFYVDVIVYALLACLYHSGSNMHFLHDQKNDGPIQEAWTKLESQTLDYVANIMQSHAFIDHTDEVNSIYALLPIISYCFQQDEHLSGLPLQKMVKWFYYAQIPQRNTNQPD